MSFIFDTLHPEIYHGRGKKPPYFEGWYFKLVSADEQHLYSIIPGVILSGESQSFVQVLNGLTGESTYFEYPLNAFKAQPGRFDIRVGRNRFTASSIALDIAMDEGAIRGELSFDGLHPWPVSRVSPGVMGWYAWLPFMECYHGVLSFDHAITGTLTIDRTPVDFNGGRGYIEKDWGQSFPEAYIWLQTNHFDAPGACLSASAAIIPSLGAAFPGFIVGLWLGDRLFRFATYTGAKLEKLTVSDDEVFWALSDREHRLEIRARRAAGGLLKAPSKLGMGRRVNETLNSSVDVRLTAHAGGVLFESTGRHVGLEVFDYEKLLKMVEVGYT
jgi:tocopherol cyclase